MAQVFSLAARTTNTTSSQSSVEYRSAAANRPAVMEIGYTSNVATAQVLGLGRPAAQGVTPTNTLLLGEDNADTALTNQALAWSTSPTNPTNYFRRTSLPNVVGSGYIYTFPRGLILPFSASLVVHNIIAAVASDAYAVLTE